MKYFIYTITICLMLCIQNGFAEELNASIQTAKKILDSYQNALVKVVGVSTMEAQIEGLGNPGVPQESRFTSNGIVLDDSGLIITSFPKIGRMLPAVNISGERHKLTVSTTYSNLKIVLFDGTTIPARIIFEDKDLGIKLLLPEHALKEEVQKKITVFDLEPEEDVKQFDRYIAIRRLSKDLNYTATADFGLIHAVVDKPRKTYILPARPNTPICSSSGKFLGVSVWYPNQNMQRMAGFQEIAGGIRVIPAAKIRALVLEAKKHMK